MTQLIEYLDVCEGAARIAGRLLVDMMGRVAVREKGPCDLVTEADEAAQEAIRKRVLTAYPMHGFLAEENAAIPPSDDGLRWIVDPLDGTTNFVHGVAQFAVSIALERRGELLAGVVYDPMANECFTAARGHGAYLNGKRIAASSIAQLCGALVAVSFSTQVRRDDHQIEDFIEVLLRSQAMRRTGSSALNLSYVAAGRFDAYWGTTSKIWDVAAGLLLVSEAGGVVSGFDGRAFQVADPKFLVAATQGLHDELFQTLHREATR